MRRGRRVHPRCRSITADRVKTGHFVRFPPRHTACLLFSQVNRDRRKRKVPVNRIKTTTAVLLLASFAGLQPLPAQAHDQQRRDRYEDRWDRREDQRDRREDRRDRREDKRDRREDRRDRRDDRYDVHNSYWDASRYYRHDNRRYHPRRLSRNDRIYRGSDNRYYCRRDDGTTGLIVGGISGGVLGNICAPGGSKVLGTVIGAGAGALIGKAIDDGDIICR
jgi:hypothetical protein